MRRVGRGSVLLAIGAAVALTAGCGTGSASSPTPPTDSPTPAPTTVAPPRSLSDLTCADLATPSLAGLLPPETRVEVDAAWRQTNFLETVAAHFSVLSVGGIACEWTSTTPTPEEGGGEERVTVTLLPSSAAQFDTWLSADVVHPTTCSPDVSCRSETLVGSTWVSIAAEYTPLTSFDAYAAEVLDLVAAATPGATPPAPDPWSCDDIATGADLAASLGFESPLAIDQHQGIRSVWQAADDLAGTIRCSWTIPLSPPVSVGELSAVPGGAWAWDTVGARLTDPSAPVPLDVPGLGSGDSAWIRCSDTNQKCLVDLIVGGDWIEFRLDSNIPHALTLFDTRPSAIALATAIVANRS